MISEGFGKNLDNDRESERIEIRVDFLTEGATLSGATFDEEDNFLYPDHTPFTNEMIADLKARGIDKIYYSSEKVSGAGDVDHFRSQASKVMDMLHNAVARNAKPDIEVTRKLIDELHEYIIQSDKTFLHLMAIKEYDDYTYTHSVNVGVLVMVLASRLGLPETVVKEFGVGAFLHDIGKLLVPKTILNKDSALTDQELGVIREHPEKGVLFLARFNVVSDTILTIIMQHHEWYNGLGYPRGIQDSKIHLGAKLISLCDVYDALTTERSYKRAFSSTEAITTILKNAKEQFNPALVSRFIRDITPLVQHEPLLPVDTMVILNTGELARVIKVSSPGDLMPHIEILTDRERKKIKRPPIIKLAHDGERKIIKIIPKSK